MNTVIEFTSCPSCGRQQTALLLPPCTKLATTLDLIYERGRASEFSAVDLSPFVDPDFAICENCAVIFAMKRSTPEAAAAYYGRLFHVIEAPLPFDTLPIPERFIERSTKIARDLLATLSANGVLDSVRSVLWVRCNAGEGLKILRDEYGLTEIFGLEYLPSLIRHAKEVWGLENVEPMQIPEFENPFPRQKFDLIVLNEAFSHAHEPATIADTVKMLLAEGGAAVVYNEKDHSEILKSTKLFPYGMNFFHKQIYTRRSLEAFLELCGYRVEELPHPTIGRPTSLKNTKILYVLRPDAGVTPRLPTEEGPSMALAFQSWWGAHKWNKRRLRVVALFERGRRGREKFGGGEARR